MTKSLVSLFRKAERYVPVIPPEPRIKPGEVLIKDKDGKWVPVGVVAGLCKSEGMDDLRTEYENPERSDVGKGGITLIRERAHALNLAASGYAKLEIGHDASCSFFIEYTDTEQVYMRDIGSFTTKVKQYFDIDKSQGILTKSVGCFTFIVVTDVRMCKRIKLKSTCTSGCRVVAKAAPPETAGVLEFGGECTSRSRDVTIMEWSAPEGSRLPCQFRGRKFTFTGLGTFKKAEMVCFDSTASEEELLEDDWEPLAEEKEDWFVFADFFSEDDLTWPAWASKPQTS